MINTWILFTIILGLSLNLILTNITNKKVLSNKENRRNYLLVWALSALALLLANLFENNSADLLIIFYGVAGFSVPQVCVYLMTINDLKDISEDHKNTISALEDVSNQINKLFYITDVPEALQDKMNGMSCDEILEKYLNKANSLEQLGILSKEKKEEYLSAIRYTTHCFKKMGS